MTNIRVDCPDCPLFMNVYTYEHGGNKRRGRIRRNKRRCAELEKWSTLDMELRRDENNVSCRWKNRLNGTLNVMRLTYDAHEK